MRISWIKKTTLLDYPGKVATILFTPGCNLRCGFCHNPEFVLPEEVKKCMDDLIPEEVFFSFLKTRIGLLDGVVICGGEPTLQGDLPEFARKVKDLGFLVKLDTNGTNPRMIEELIREGLVDYIAMDIKDAPNHYNRMLGSSIPWESYDASIWIIMESGLDYEFRTTVVKGFHIEEDIRSISARIKGARRYFLQSFRCGKTLDSNFSGESFTDEELLVLRDTARNYVEDCRIRK